MPEEQQETAGEREREREREKGAVVEEKTETKGEHVKTSNLLLSRCKVNEVMMLYSSCLMHLLQIRVNFSLCSGFFFFFWGGGGEKELEG